MQARGARPEATLGIRRVDREGPRGIWQEKRGREERAKEPPRAARAEPHRASESCSGAGADLLPAAVLGEGSMWVRP